MSKINLPINVDGLEGPKQRFGGVMYNGFSAKIKNCHVSLNNMHLKSNFDFEKQEFGSIVAINNGMLVFKEEEVAAR